MAWQDSTEHGATNASGAWPVSVRKSGGRNRGGATRRRDGSLPAGLTILALAAIGLVALVVLFALK